MVPSVARLGVLGAKDAVAAAGSDGVVAAGSGGGVSVDDGGFGGEDCLELRLLIRGCEREGDGCADGRADGLTG